MSMSDHQSPRVNAARLPNFVGRTVRLPCKVLSVSCMFICQTSGLLRPDISNAQVAPSSKHAMEARSK
ncbi:hypothetical protein J3R83DRAFT_4985 [Lanmaoa asiatica]|nr:hypothetical protein J3R83DRAFT_4985 [Lanmaoa asiatica]